MEIYKARLPTRRRSLTMISPTLLVVKRAARAHVVDALGAQVSIEMQQSNRLFRTFRCRSKQRQRNRVISADNQQRRATCGQVQGVLLDGLNGLIDVERVDGHVPSVQQLGS